MILQNFWLEMILILALDLRQRFFAAAEIAIITIRKSRIDALIEGGVGRRRRPAQKRSRPISRHRADRRHCRRFVRLCHRRCRSHRLSETAHRGAAGSNIAQAVKFSRCLSWSCRFPIFRWSSASSCPNRSRCASPNKSLVSSPRPSSFCRGHALFVKALTASSNAVLRIFGGKEVESASFISVEEVKSLIREGAAKGIFNETEKELIHSVFEFTDTPVKAVMIPRTEIHAIEAHAS